MIRSILLVLGVILAYLIGCLLGESHAKANALDQIHLLKQNACQIEFIVIRNHLLSRTYLTDSQRSNLNTRIVRYTNKCKINPDFYLETGLYPTNIPNTIN